MKILKVDKDKQRLVVEFDLEKMSIDSAHYTQDRYLVSRYAIFEIDVFGGYPELKEEVNSEGIKKIRQQSVREFCELTLKEGGHENPKR